MEVRRGESPRPDPRPKPIGWRKVEELFRRTRDLRLTVTLPELRFLAPEGEVDGTEMAGRGKIESD